MIQHVSNHLYFHIEPETSRWKIFKFSTRYTESNFLFCSQTFAPSQSLNAKMKHDRTKKAVLKSIRSVHVRRQLLVRRRTIFTLPRSSFLQFPTRETTNAAEADPLFSWKPYPQQLVNPTDKNKKTSRATDKEKKFHHQKYWFILLHVQGKASSIFLGLGVLDYPNLDHADRGGRHWTTEGTVFNGI